MTITKGKKGKREGMNRTVHGFARLTPSLESKTSSEINFRRKKKEFQHNPCHRQKMPHDDPFTPPAPVATSEHPIPNPSKPEPTSHHAPLRTIQPVTVPGASCSSLHLSRTSPSPPELGPGGHTFPCLQNQNFSFNFQQESSEPQGGAAIPGKNPNPWREGGKKGKRI